MMSTAILMAASLEQMGVHPVSTELLPDTGREPKEMSFAKSFHERVGGTDLPQGKSSKGEAEVALPSLKSGALAKLLDEVAAAPVAVKEKLAASQQMPEHSELKSISIEKAIQSHVPARAGIEKKAVAVDSGTKMVDLSEQMEEPVDDLSGAPPLSAQPTVGVAGEVVEASISVTGEVRSSISNGGSRLPKDEMENAGLKKDSVLVKKSAKSQERAAAPKTVQKSTGTVVAESKPVTGSPVDGTIPPAGQIVAPTVALDGEMGNPTDAISKAAAGVEKSFAGVAPGTADYVFHKNDAVGAKVNAVGTEAMVPAEFIVPSKTGVEPEKMAVAAIPEGKDSDSKTQSNSVPTVATVHAITAGVGTSGVGSTAVAFGNTQGDLIAAKLPVGDASAHATSLLAGAKEQNGLGTTAATPGEMPQMLTATPTTLEVGIQNGTHGWLKVRAEMADGGAVNASVSAASSSGQEMLHRELPALTAYLQDEKIAVNAIVVHTPSVAGADARSSAGMGQASGQTSQRNDGGGEQHQNVRKTALNDGTVLQESLRGVDEDVSLPLATYATGGAWLSVRA